MQHGLRHRFFGWWAGVVTRYPVAILIVATAAVLAAVVYSYAHWQFQSDRNLLISNKLEWNKRFIEIEDRLPGSHDMAIVIDAGPKAGVTDSPEFQQARAVVDELGPKLKASPLVASIVWGFDPSAASPKAMRLLPMDQFKAQVSKIADSGPMLASDTPEALIGNIQQEMFKQAMGQMLGGAGGGAGGQPAAKKDDAAGDAKAAADIHDLNRLLQTFELFLSSPPTKPLDFAALATSPEDRQATWEYLPSENGRLLFIRLGPREDEKLLDPLEPALKAIRAIVADVAARHPSVQVGITGLEVMDAEETQVATWDSTWTSILATILITGLLILAFHGWRTPVLAVLALLYGVAWTYGFLFLVVGHLQVLSVIFNVMLLGLGIAYGIYLASAFELIRHDYPDDIEGFRQTLARTLEMMGPGIATGSCTTAAAFATTIFTDFTGVAEMGVIAGAGILLCLVAMFTVFPVFLRLFKSDHKHITPMEDRYVVFFQPAWAMPFVRYPVITLVFAGILTVGSALAITQMRFDFDLIKLQPRHAPSVEWMQRIVNDGKEEKIWSNITIVNTVEEGRTMAARFRAMPTVGDVGGVGLLFPADEDAKLAILEKLKAIRDAALAVTPGELPKGQQGQQGLGNTPATLPATTAATSPKSEIRNQKLEIPSKLLSQLSGLRLALGMATRLGKVPPVILAAMKEVDATLARTADATAHLTPAELDGRLDRLTRAYQGWRLDSAWQIAAALDLAPLFFTDLPHDVMSDYQDNQGHYVLEVYPNLKLCPNGPLDPVFLPRFVADTQSVEPKISGIMAQIYWSGALIKGAYENAGYVALALVFLIVLFDYAGWQHTLVALPLAINLATPYRYNTWVWAGLFVTVVLVFTAVPRFRRGFHDAMLILLPVAMAFAITFGIMWVSGMQVNAANIIVLPLMFGIGVDSGVHVLNRYRQDPDGEPVGLTQGTGKGITITCLTSVIGFGAMILSSHRGISSLGVVLTLGLTMTMVACWTVMPAWLELRKRYRQARR